MALAGVLGMTGTFGARGFLADASDVTDGVRFAGCA